MLGKVRLIKRYAYFEATKREAAGSSKMVVPFYQTTRVIGQKSKIKTSYRKKTYNLKYFFDFLRFESSITRLQTPTTMCFK